MRTPLHRALLGIFAGLGLISVFQARCLIKAPRSVHSTATQTIELLPARLNGISLSIVSYLQNHDSQSLEQMKSEGKEASQLVEEYKSAAAREGDAGTTAQLDKAYDDMRRATLELLSADSAQMKIRDTLSASSEELMSILIARIEPSIKPSQLHASARLQAVIAAAAEAKSFTKNPGRISELDTSQSRFNHAVDAYAALSRSRRAERWEEEAKLLFSQCLSHASELDRAGVKKQAALNDYARRRNSLDVVLQETLSAPLQGLSFASLRNVFSSGLAGVAFAGLFLAAGILLVLRLDRQVTTEMAWPLQEILSCAEAAASGDVSRLPARCSAPDEIGRLGRSVGRLITVLARSENLVYHLAALVESSGDAIISYTPDGTVLSWNNGAQRIYGYTAEEMKGRSITLLAPYEGGPEMLSQFRKICQGERLRPFETIHRARSGRAVRVFVRVAAIFDSTHKVIGASFCAQDLSDVPAFASKAIEDSKTA